MKKKLRTYRDLIRIKKPIGIILLFLPCLFGLALAAKKLPEFDLLMNLKLGFLFLLGSIVMRSAGCVINDLFDIKFDRKVERTKSRPLAKKLISKKESLIFLVFLLLFGLLILLQFNQATIVCGLVALAFALSYPLMKRITYYPQVFLGITFNLGVLMSALAIFEVIDSDFIILYFASVIWTVVYDTVYAYQDIEDDLKIGVKSTAIKFGKNPKNILEMLSLTMFLCLFYLGVVNDFSILFFLLTFFTAAFLIERIKKCDFQNPQNCLKLFKDNGCIGLLILIAISLG